ncbi:SdrD B-like domain-containing protein [Spirosoma aerolatum]|uniref:SdrD B-like domain-containing protein n=1 Tax=Spirosoma aerolatum TaxID=1211326 RepID=UPI0014739D37|nr:SdrD B-like domain-containing protein [Spirosoma aerolatum]
MPSHRLILLVALLLTSIGFAKAQCSITLAPTVSGCYSVSGVSKATVSVEVGWTNAPDGDYIVVTTGTQSRTIIPGVSVITYPQPSTIVITGTQKIVSPQVVAFELALSGGASTGTITAHFASNTSCQASQTYAIPAACPPTSCTGTQLGGTVFRDFNADGIKQATETQGVSSVTVTAFDCDGVKYGPVVTDQFGKYVFTSTTVKYPVRVEFRTAAGNDMGTIYGSNSHSNVQFVDQAMCSVDLGIANPYLYCQTDPQIFIPCYTYGDPLTLNPTTPVATSALSASAAAVVSFPYDESTTGATGMSHWAEAGQVGTVWGLGYNRLTKDIFMAATLHRHSGLGPLGIGGIYVTHTKSSTITEGFIDVTTLGVDVGAASVPENGSAGRGLSADLTKPSHDPDVFPLIGKVGIGGLEVAEDGQKLWFVNLNDKKLYSIDISAYNASGTLPTNSDVKSYAIPDPGCAGGESRPWALHIYNNKLYVGTVCDAFDSKSKSKLRAYVYAFDPGTSVFTPVFDFPLTYPKGYGISPLNSAGQAGADSTGWYPWTDTFSDLVIATSTASYKSLVHPQPILADIDFDVDGSMVLGFADRTGFQGGYNNYSPDLLETQLYTVNPAAGDILRAYYSNGSYILENNGQVGPYTGVGVDNNQGPGFGEFYDDNYISGNRYTHTELVLGGLALRLGSGHVVGATIDPVANIANSGGVKYWNNETGKAEGAAIVYTTSTAPGTFAKASGLGEPELNCDLLEVIEIGNRVWVDTNKDGVQDPCEKSLSGVQVDLYKGTTKIASTTTNANGEYYFSSKSALTTGSWLGTSADTTLLPNTAYALVFGAGQFNNSILTVNGSELQVTVANSATTNASDLNDSDALIETVAGVTAPVISLTTGNAGYINHNLDAGFSCLPTTVASVSVTAATCNGGTANNNAHITVSGIQNADKVFLAVANSVLPSYTATGSQPVSASAASFTGLSNPASTSGQSYSVVVYNGPCCYTVLTTSLPYTNCCSLSATATPTACNSVTNEYTLDGTISLAGNTSGGVATVTNGVVSTTVNIAPNATTASYSLTGLISDGASFTVTVNLSSCGSATAAYAAPASCTIAPPALLVSISTPVCNTLTNNYTATGTVSMSNVVAGTLTITDNGTSLTTITVTTGQTTASFSVSGVSNAASHTVVATLSGDPLASTTYSAPTACTVCSTSITTASLPDGQVGTFYSQTLTASGGLADYTYALSGTLPDGLTLSASGVISGTPTASGTANFTVNVSDAHSCSDAQPLTIIIDAIPECALVATATPGVCNTATNTYQVTGTISATNAVVNGAATQSLTVSVGSISTIVSLTGNGPVSYTLAGLNSDGLTKTVSVVSSATACGSTSVTYTAPASCTVCSLTITTTALASATVGSPYSQTISTTGGSAPLTFTIASGNLPPGLVLNNTSGVISGTTTTNGSFPVTILVSDAKSCTATVPLTLSVACETILYSPITLANGQVGTPYSQTLTPLNGLAPYTFGITNGELPDGLTLDGSTGVISGTPTATGAFSFTGFINDDYECPTVVSFTMTISSAPVCSLTATATPGVCNTATNTYQVTGTVSSTNAVVNLASPQSLTITDLLNGSAIVSTVLSLTGNGPVSYTLSGIPSDGLEHSVTVISSATTCGTTSMTYTAPTACTVCSTSITTASLPNGQVGTAYSQTLTVSGGTGTLSFTNVGSLPAGLTLNGSTGVISGTPTASGTITFTIAVTDAKSCSDAQPLTIGISDAPVCSLTATATPGQCNTATNQYTLTGTVAATNATGTQSLTISVGSVSTVVSLSANGPVSYTLSGLNSDEAVHTVSVLSSATACGSASVTYTAPASCTVALASLGDFVWIDLNKDGIQDGIEPGIEGVNVTLFINGVASTTTATDASGLYSFTGLTPGSSFSYSVGFTAPTGYTTTTPLSGTDKAKDSDADLITGKTASVTLAPGEFNQTLDAGYIAPELPATIASLGDFVWLDSDKNGIQDFGEPPIQGVTAILYVNGVASATTVTNASGFYSFTGLTPGSSNSYVVGFTAPAGYTATTPYSGTDRTKDSNANLVTGKTESVTLAPGEFNQTLDAGYYALPPVLTLDKVVDKSKAKQGDTLTYTLVLTNTGSTTATNVTVRDSTTIGLSYVANSASAPIGTTFTQGNPVSLWTVSSLTPGQSLSLTFQAKADSSGILYNVATIPGDTAKVCTSIPVKVCQGSSYLFELVVAAGRTSYKWYRDGVEIVGATTNVLSVTAAGTYSLVADGGSGQCSDFSCCPFIVEEDTLPTFKAVAIPVTCVGNVAQTNGQIVLSEFKAGYTYQYSLGNTFNASATLSGATKAIPVDGVIVSNLANPVTTQSYTIRVYNSNGCYTDVTVLMTPTVCGCPASVCVPLVIRQTKGPVRGGH